MEELAFKINQSIKNNELYKKYLSLKRQIDNSDYLCSLRDSMDRLKKEICKGEEDRVNKYYEVEKEYKENVLVKEFEVVKGELYDLFKDIVDILSLK